MEWWALTLATVVLSGCSNVTAPPDAAPLPSAMSSPARSTSTVSPTPSPTLAPSTPGRAHPDEVDPRTATRAVRHLAGVIGPRPGHTRAYTRAASWVQRQLVASGWVVERQQFLTPAGVSWGVPVEAGPSHNLVATRGEVRPDRPWLLVGAHLDTVPQSPGAEDNASGVGALLAAAQAVARRRTRLPVVLVAFGSEEPRGPGDDDHHYGSRAYVASLTAAQRSGLRGAVSLDRVGVGEPW